MTMDEVEIKRIVETVLKDLSALKCIEDITYANYRMPLTVNLSNRPMILDVNAVSKVELARCIDHTLLRSDATCEDIEKLCQEAVRFGFAAVCVNPCWVSPAKKFVSGSNVKVATVVGFPLGVNATETKAFEASLARQQGADEFDMVINVGALKSGDIKLVFEDIRAVVNAVPCGIVKVIIETALLTDEEKVKACAISKLAGAHFVKTSTGFSKTGATVEDVILMKSVVAEGVEVKASGGIRDFETAMAMIKAGATRIGTSASVAIIEGKEVKSNY